MRLPRSALVVAAGTAAAAAAAGIASWYRRFDWAGDPDEVLSARTADGWHISLYRYRAAVPAKPYPIVCGHGSAGTHLLYDLGPDCSLARTFAGAGYDTYLVDLRGRGESWPRGGPDRGLNWTFDDFVAHDLPTAVDAACERSGANQAFWFGTEMSGQLLYAAAITGTAQRIRAGITAGAPAVTPPYAEVPGVTAPPRTRRGTRVPFRSGARWAGPVLAVSRSRMLASSFVPAHSDPLAVGRYLHSGIPDESVLLAEQFADWIEHATMRSADGALCYSDRLAEVRLPVMVAAGALDRQRPPDAVRETFEALGSEDKTWLLAGTEAGFGVDFGHDDLLASAAARREVWPAFVAWFDARC